MTVQELTELNPEQQKAFNRLKKAYKDCEKLGVFFANRYGALYGYDKKKIKNYGDRSSGFPESETVPANDHGDYLRIANEWSDDSHLFHVTPRAMLALQQESFNKSIEGFNDSNP